MTICKTCVLIACVLGLAQFMWGQNAAAAQTPAVTVEEVDAASPSTGTLVFKFTFTITSTVPKNGVVSCEADATSVGDANGVFDEKGFSIATHASGSTWDCTVTIPYSWHLATPGSDKIQLFHKADISYGLQVTATNGAATTVIGPLSTRHHDGPVGVISVPANGTTTTENVSVTL